MLQIINNTKKRTTTALIENCELDAIEHITKRLGVKTDIYYTDNECVGCNCCQDESYGTYGDCENCYELTEAEDAIMMYQKALCLDRAELAGKYAGTSHCHPEDDYDKTIGKAIAIAKARKNHNRAFCNAIVKWQVAMLKKVKEVSPETFESALQSIDKKVVASEKEKVDKKKTVKKSAKKEVAKE